METLSRRERERLAHEDEIIEAGERIFGLKGFDNASMDDIAKEAQFTKKTLYQYFGNKEDLFFAVVLRGFGKLVSYLKAAYDENMTGYMKIKEAFGHYYRFYKENPKMMRIMGSIGYVRQHSAESLRRNDFTKANNDLFKSVADAIEEGKTDGSITSALDTQKLAYSLVFLMTGFFSQLTATGESFTNYFSLNLDEFSLFTMESLLGILKTDSGIVKNNAKERK